MSGLFGRTEDLTPYQVQDVAAARELGRAMLAWDTGMGKTWGALALGCALLDDGEIDTVLLVCEQNKLGEWERDVARYTSASVGRYHGKD